MTFVIRYVSCESEKKLRIEEYFLGFVPVESSTGEALTNTLTDNLKEMNINLDYMRGQSYDNGANMMGKNLGVLTRILKINPRVFIVPCNAHSLNLVVNDASSSCTKVDNR